VRSSVEPLDDNRVRLTVEVDVEEFEPEIEAAFQRIAREVRVPGFRPGRAPRRLLEVRLGREAGRAEAMRTCIPSYYQRAVAECGVDDIDSPKIEITGGQQHGPLSFSAVVQVRPVVEVAGYEGLRVQVPSPIVTAEEIDAEIDGFRRQFAELREVRRPAGDGDHLTIDISCTLSGETVDGLTTSDYDYELGAGFAVREIDDNLRGSSAGDILDFTAAHPDTEIESRLHFRVLVKAVKQTVLPELNDEFVEENSEFATVGEMRETLRERHTRLKVMNSSAARWRATERAIAALVEDDIPEAMIVSHAESRRAAIEGSLQEQGTTLEEYLDAAGRSSDDFQDELDEHAEIAAKVDLVLRFVASAENLEPAEDEIEAELRRLAGLGDAADVSTAGEVDRLAQMRQNPEVQSMMSEVRAAMSKRAAFSWINERVVIVDPDGMTIDPELLELPDAADGNRADAPAVDADSGPLAAAAADAAGRP